MSEGCVPLWLSQNWVAIIAIVISVTSLFYSVKRFRLEKRNSLLRPHSIRLSEDFAKWISSNNFFGQILDTTFDTLDHKIDRLNQDASEFEKGPKPINLPKYAIKHLESGYPKLYEKISEFREKVNDHNKKVVKYVLSLCQRLENELKLPDRSGEEMMYYARTIIFISKKILFSTEPSGDPYMTKKKDTWFVRWSGADLVRSHDEENVGERLR